MRNKTTFWNFIQKYKIEIPIIQRDYAQGREGKEYIRKTFLEKLKQALDGELPNDEKQLKLDFVYGSNENDKLNPLDGQQRLTTLWLLHWYIALKAEKLTDVAEILNNFSYETRISSREFCQELCKVENFNNYNKEKKEGDTIVKFITKHTWFYSTWKQDPTIQAMLRMLEGSKDKDKKGDGICDGIEKIFATTNKERFEAYWKKLTESEVIIFYYLPLQDFGLSDDLYIKMNARGKQLTSFENFKADLIGYIEQKAKDDTNWKKLLNSDNGIPIKLDTSWTDIFWGNRSIGKDVNGVWVKQNSIDEIYFAFFNRFFWNELFIAKSDDQYVLNLGKGEENYTQENENKSYSYLNDSENPNDFDVKIAYTYFDVYKYFNGDIPSDFFFKLSTILDRYKKIENFPVCKWNNNFQFIPVYDKNKKGENIEIRNNSNENILKVSSLNQVERIVFYAVCKYLNEGEYEAVSFKRWMRVVWNLISGEDGSGRPEIRSTQAMRTAIEFISSLDSHNIYSSLKNYQGISGNSSFDERCKEEIDKAGRVLNDDNDELRKYDGTCKKEDGTEFDTWEDVIIEAESYAFFKGAIRFLFRNEKGETAWSQFDTKLENAKNLIPIDEYQRHTIKELTPYLKLKCIEELYYSHWVSNKDEHLRALFLDNRGIEDFHSFFLQEEKKYKSPVHSDIITLCEKAFNGVGYLQTNWNEAKYIWTNRATRHGYYWTDCFIIGDEIHSAVTGIIQQKCQCEHHDNFVEDAFYKDIYLRFKYKENFFVFFPNITICLMNYNWEGKCLKYPNEEDTIANNYYFPNKEMPVDMLSAEAIITAMDKLINQSNQH